jgi:hypothetical protein
METLHAGPVTMLLDGIDLRYVRIGRTELVRRIYVAVRDRDWNTIPAEVSGLEIEAQDDSFEVRFDARHRSAAVDLSWRGAIMGDARGRVEYVFDARGEADMLYNRIGICVHHPWRECAGRAYRARTPDGEIAGSFPALIGPQRFEDGVYRALFPAFDRLDVALPGGGSLRFDFEGDLWETEDHRNWTDANYKTYSTPLALGFPHELKAGQSVRQRVSVGFAGIRGGEETAGAVGLSIGEPTGTRVPAIGLGVDSDGHVLTEAEAGLVSALAPAHLRVEVRLGRDGWADALAGAQRVAGQLGCALEVSLHLRPEHAGELPAVAAALAAGPAVDRVLVILAGGRTSTPEETTPAPLVDLARASLAAALPGTAFLGGTEIYFTEINRTRPDAATWDGVCFSITPQIHAFTDLDIVENLDAQGENIRSALALAGGKPVVVSPITIRRRLNFHAADPDDVPETPPGELPDAVDIRQSSLLGAAWTAGSLKYVAEAGAASVTYYETTGWRGVVERESGSPLPDRFHSTPGQAFPLYHPLADVAGWGGAEVLECASAEPLSCVGLAVRGEDGATRVLVANVTAHELDAVVEPLTGSFRLRRLHAESAEQAASRPAEFRAGGETVEARYELALSLAPYEVVRIDPA